MYINPVAMLAFVSRFINTPASTSDESVLAVPIQKQEEMSLKDHSAPFRRPAGKHRHRHHDNLRKRDYTIWKTETVQYTVPAAKTVQATAAAAAATTMATTLATKPPAQEVTATIASDTTSAIAAAFTSSPIAASSGPKKVFAHFMMGNAYPMSVADFAANIASAAAVGIDGFALNVGPDDWMSDRVSKMYEAASGTSFKLFISLDMAVMASSGISQLTPWVTNYASHANQFYYNNKQFVSTFAGEGSTFGQSDAAAGWNLFKSTLAAQGHNIFFVPSFTALGPSAAMSMSSNDGSFSWDAWPTTDSPMTTAEDDAYMNDRQEKVYMAGVSPWFYTHFSYKNWIYKSDDLFTTRWEQIVSMQPDFVEIITWNDYGESSYIGQISGATPYDGEINSSVWTYGYDHSAWAALSAYYIQAYKNGAYPAITSNKLFWWYRSHSKDAIASADPYGKPTNYNWAADNIYLTLLLTAQATIVVTSGGASQTFTGVPGKNHFQFVGFGTGKPTVSITMNGVSVLTAEGPMAITSNPAIYNFNPVVVTNSF